MSRLNLFFIAIFFFLNFPCIVVGQDAIKFQVNIHNLVKDDLS